jgi:hypothetical protein
MNKQVRTLYTMYDNRMYCKTTDNEIYYMPIDKWQSLYNKGMNSILLGNQLFNESTYWSICDDSCQVPGTYKKD